MRYKTALYLGRFQPFHLGHLQLIEGLSANYKKIVIGLCSCQKHGTRRNPFTFWDRYQMLHNTLSNNPTLSMRKTKLEIIPIPDIECPEKWASFVHAIFGDYDVVITNNPDTKHLFESIGDKVEGYPKERVECHTFMHGYGWLDVSGTIVRDCILSGLKYGHYDYHKFVPLEVWLYIEKHKLDLELKRIYNRSGV